MNNTTNWTNPREIIPLIEDYPLWIAFKHSKTVGLISAHITDWDNVLLWKSAKNDVPKIPVMEPEVDLLAKSDRMAFLAEHTDNVTGAERVWMDALKYERQTIAALIAGDMPAQYSNNSNQCQFSRSYRVLLKRVGLAC